jgi:small subunit ribosomal protein S4
MGKYNGPKDRLSRREGVDLFGAGAKLTRLNILPGVHGPKGIIKKQSQYGKQLREKQKVKRIYGLMEKQFRILVEKALKSKGNTGEALLILLERRLDNVVYKLGFAESRPMARQLVSHRHVLVNGKKLNIPSYHTEAGDVISLTSKILENTNVKKVVNIEDYQVPSWLERKSTIGKVSSDPKRSDITEIVSEQDIVEFYSR